MQPFSLTSSKKDFFLLRSKRRKLFFLFCSKVHFRSSFFSFFLSPMSENAISRWNVQLLRTSAVFPDKSSREKGKRKKTNKIPAVFLRQLGKTD